MKKKTAIVMISLLALSLMLSASFHLQETTVEAQYPPWHWKVMLAQKGCNTRIKGNLTYYGEYIPGSDFDLVCICGLPEPQPLGQFVFCKIPTDVIPNDIHYNKYLDLDKDGIWEIVEPVVHGEFYPTPPPDEPHTWYQHVEEGAGWMVVVEVREQPYDEERPFFEWQLTIKQHNVNASWTGYLTKDGFKLPGTDFNIFCDRSLMCTVVKTEWCTVPNDIHYTLIVDGTPIVVDVDEDVTQFPWTRTETVGSGKNVTLELTEVQMHRYIVMGGTAENCAQLGPFEEMWWNVPYASRPPDYTPLQEQSLNITFTQRDPITGIVKLGVPSKKGFLGVRHVFYSPTSDQYYNVTTFTREQGCGYLFTGQGKNPILGDVDVVTWNNDTGVYSNKTGELIKLGPCLQEISGPDGIPGTGDSGDIFGDGIPDPPGSSVLYLPTIVRTEWSLPGLPQPVWILLYEAPYPNVFTTATTNDTVVETDSVFDGTIASAKGEPWEFFAGIDHKKEGYNVTWKHSKCNAYVTAANAWSLLNIPTSLGDLDLLWRLTYKLVREDCVIADINSDEVVNIKDIVTCALAFGTKDETYGKPYADPNFNARGDLMSPEGNINIKDIVRIAVDFGAKLTPNCIIRPT